jgi:hypothetical protein
MKFIPAMEHPVHGRQGAFQMCHNCGCWDKSAPAGRKCDYRAPESVDRLIQFRYDNGWTTIDTGVRQ